MKHSEIEDILPEKKLPPRKAGRPKQADVAALTDHIIAVARDLFYEEGFGHTTMDKIAVAAHISKKTLYKKFSSKAEIFAAMVKSSMDTWETGRASNPHIETKTLEEFIHHTVSVQVRASDSYEFKNLVRLIYAESNKFPNLAKLLADTSYEYRINFVAREIEKYAEIDGIPVRDPFSAAHVLRSMVAGATQAAQVQSDYWINEGRDAMIDRISEIFLASRASW